VAFNVLNAEALNLLLAVLFIKAEFDRGHKSAAISLGESMRLKRPMRHKCPGRRLSDLRLWPTGLQAVPVRRRFRD
jgi:hypothetical protein